MAKKINLNKLAQAVTQAEGGARSLPIGQVKEVIRLTIDKLAAEKPSAVLATLEARQG